MRYKNECKWFISLLAHAFNPDPENCPAISVLFWFPRMRLALACNVSWTHYYSSRTSSSYIKSLSWYVFFTMIICTVMFIMSIISINHPRKRLQLLIKFINKIFFWMHRQSKEIFPASFLNIKIIRFYYFMQKDLRTYSRSVVIINVTRDTGWH